MPTTSTEATVVPMSEERLRELLMKERAAHLAQVRAIEEFLGMEPKVQATCPNCSRVWNKRV